MMFIIIIIVIIHIQKYNVTTQGIKLIKCLYLRN